MVGKLHNFVNAVCASHRRRELLLETQSEVHGDDTLFNHCTLQLRQDGGVRWHSVYLMMLRCLELREPIKRFIRKLRTQRGNTDRDSSDPVEAAYDPLTDSLTDDEWDEVSELVDFLNAPYQMTRRLEGSNSVSGFGSLWQTLTNLQALWSHYRQASARAQMSQYFQSAVSFGYEKLNTYFERLFMEPTPSFYTIATALHPKLRLAWFKTHWKDFPAWHIKADKSVRTTFKRYVDLEIESEAAEEHLSPPPTRRRHAEAEESWLFDSTMTVDLMLLTGSRSHKRQKRVSQLDEYFDDLRADLTGANPTYMALLDDPWRWWLEIGRSKYPIVFKMAVDYLSIPPTSCECERAFSSARRTITCDCNSLTGATIEALQLQKSWLRRGVVESELIKLQHHVETLQRVESSN